MTLKKRKCGFERTENTMKKWMALWLLLLIMLPISAFAGEMDAGTMERWLDQFCQALPSVPMLGDPQLTADPARPGEYLLEYEFGTVTATSAQRIAPEDIVQIDVRTQQVTDCMGRRVGMTLDDVLDGAAIGQSNTQLYVLGTQEAGIGFSWAYLGEAGVYGVEHITYGGEGASMTEYTLTYVMDAGVVSAIRIRCAQATQVQALQAMNTAEEIAQRQRGEVYAVKNGAPALSAKSLQIMGVNALGMQVSELVSLLGEPVEVQTLPANQGRLLLYEGAAVELMLHEQTGEEIVCGVSAGSSDVLGPHRLSVGMSVQEAASLFACDEDVYAVGGVIYMRGEAAGEAPYAELVRSELGGEAKLRYFTWDQTIGTAVLEISVQDGLVRNWRFYMEKEAI